MGKGNRRSMGTSWGAFLVVVVWFIIIGISLNGCGLSSIIDRIECGQHMQHCQGEQK